MARKIPETYLDDDGEAFGMQPELEDLRDWKFADKYGDAEAEPLPETFSFRKRFTEPRGQGPLSCCTAFAITSAAEAVENWDKDGLFRRFSPLFHWYETRKKEGTVKSNVGCGLRDVMWVATNVGLTQEKLWPYNRDRWATKPSAPAYKDAPKWKLGAYHRCYTIPEILNALHRKLPVVLGYSVFGFKVGPDGIMPIPSASDAKKTGHAVVLCGFDQKRKLLEFKNSRNTTWGDGGFGWLPYAYIERDELHSTIWALEKQAV